MQHERIHARADRRVTQLFSSALRLLVAGESRPMRPPAKMAALFGRVRRTLTIMTVRVSGVLQPSVWASVVSDDAQSLRGWLLRVGFTEDLGFRP